MRPHKYQSHYKPTDTKILCIETNELFDRRKDVIKKYPKAWRVSEALDGRRKSAGGFTWLWVEFTYGVIS
jgi:hypothetical protein